MSDHFDTTTDRFESGATARSSDLNALIDKIGAAFDATSYHGRVNSDGTAIRLPTGWTSSLETPGSTYTHLRVTHNLGTANYTVVISGNTLNGIDITAFDAAANSFDVAEYGYATPFSFTLIKDAL